MKAAMFEEVVGILTAEDIANNRTGETPPENEVLVASLDTYFSEREHEKAVLGIDIYRYSQFDNARQRLIPTLFDVIYKLAAGFCTDRERFIFHDQTLRERFIPTGDGGFQLLDTPLHGLIFAIYFQLAVETYNSFFAFPRLRGWLGPLTLRYALTSGTVFRQDSNFFGSAIISNARILAKDSLNRFLIDGACVEWFRRHIINIETLLTVVAEDICRMPGYVPCDTPDIDRSLIFGGQRGDFPRALRALQLQKIGTISSKQATLDVYNLYMQVLFSRLATELVGDRLMIVTVGNLNTSGVSG
jgi:hypothetical protein